MDKYRKIAKLGKGGMAHVSLAAARGPGGFSKLVVIKELRQELADDEDFLAMFLDEARISARLQHPNIVHTYDIISEGDQHWIVMEYLEGEPLNRIRTLGDWRKLPLDLHLRVISDALAGLHYAHELKGFDDEPLGVIHRDVSPHNIFVQFDGQVKLLDFGVAKVRGALSTTGTGVVKGKLAYMAPEVLTGQRLDRRADIFSVGVMLWEAIARTKISKGRTDVELTGTRVAGVNPDLRVLAPDAPDALVEICARAMATEPENRFASALELREALEEQIPKEATSAALGSFVSESFASRRESIRANIHDYLEQSGEHDSLPSLPTGDVSGSSKVVITDSSQTVNLGAGHPEGRRKERIVVTAGVVLLLGIAGAGWLALHDGGAVTRDLAVAPSADPKPMLASEPAGSSQPADFAAPEQSAEPAAFSAGLASDAGADAGSEKTASAGGSGPLRRSTGPRSVSPGPGAASKPADTPGAEKDTSKASPMEGADLAKPAETGSRPIIEDDPYAK